MYFYYSLYIIVSQKFYFQNLFFINCQQIYNYFGSGYETRNTANYVECRLLKKISEKNSFDLVGSEYFMYVKLFNVQCPRLGLTKVDWTWRARSSSPTLGRDSGQGHLSHEKFR